MPRGSLSFLACPGGLPVPVGCLVLSVWPRRAFLSCHVLSYLSSPGGLLISPNYPREILWGGRRIPAGPRDEATAMKTTCHGFLSSLHCHGLLSSLHLPWPPELPAPPWPPSSVLLWRSLSCGPVRVCPEGPPERPPPPPWWNCYSVGHAFWEGGVISGFCCVCHVFLPLVSIFGLFPVLVKCDNLLICVQLCLSRYL